MEFLGYLSGFTSIVTSIRHVFFASGRAPSDESQDDGYRVADLRGSCWSTSLTKRLYRLCSKS